MDDPVTRNAMASVLCPLVIALAANPVAAEDLPDPMRPAVAAAKSDSDQAGAAVGDLVLQSVLVSSQRRVAVISGQVVPLGGRIDAWRLVRLTESQAWLRGPEGERMLDLYGAAARQLVKSAPVAPLKRPRPQRTDGS
jgi:hypothetical protein